MDCYVDPIDSDLLNERGWYIKDGYVVRNTYKGARRTTERLHVLIMERIMNEPVPKGYDVHHKDENPLNNSRSNLQLLSKSAHIQHHWLGKSRPELAERNQQNRGKKLPYMSRDTIGDKNPRSKVSDIEWLWGIEELFKGNFKTNADLARHFSVNRVQVGLVLSGISRRHLQPQILELKQFYGRI